LSTKQLGPLGGGRERVLRLAWLLSLGSPVTAGYAAFVGTSVVLVADLVRSVSESVAILLSWLSYRAVQRRPEPVEGSYVRSLYGRVGLAIAVVMWISAGLIAVGAIASLRNPQHVANVWAGVLVSAGGVVYNLWFWRRYLLIAQQDGPALFGSQWRFYRAKAVVNATVLVSLIASSLLSNHAWSAYIDVAGSFAVATFLLVSGAGSAGHALADMR
jgi:divalent metal cation (Fe/Co/Zn/Cd) transporter